MNTGDSANTCQTSTVQDEAPPPHLLVLEAANKSDFIDWKRSLCWRQVQTRSSAIAHRTVRRAVSWNLVNCCTTVYEKNRIL